jgi:hypothetical protein
VTLVCVLASIVGWSAGSASAALLDVYEAAATVEVPRPADPGLPTDSLATRVTSLDQPNYDLTSAPLGSDTRAQLNAAADGLGTDIAGKEEQLTSDQTQQDDMSGCMKGALWDIGFDAVYDLATNQSFSLSNELGATYDRMYNCLGQQLGLGPIAATSTTNYLWESVVSRATQALNADPSTTEFVDWAAVTAYYSIQ